MEDTHIMPDERPTDLDKARNIVRRHGTFVGSRGDMPENIAKAVAEGIALGREEGIALAAEAIARLKDKG
jgi:hypothetical protein